VICEYNFTLYIHTFYITQFTTTNSFYSPYFMTLQISRYQITWRKPTLSPPSVWLSFINLLH